MSRSSDGHKSICKQCILIKAKEYRKANSSLLVSKQTTYYEKNKDAVKRYQREYYKTNSNHIKAQSKEYHRSHIDKDKEYDRQIKHLYNITVLDVQLLMISQHGCCDICKKPFQYNNDKKEYHIDHNHTTNKVRGLLCTNCNTSIGLLQENPVFIESALYYINKHNNS